MRRPEPPTAIRLPDPWPPNTYAIRGGTIGEGLIADLAWTDPRNVRTRRNGRRYCAECDRITQRARHAAKRAA